VRRTTRREVIGAAAVGAAAFAAPPALARRAFSRRAGVGPGAFLEGVASGEPSANAITFWSRITTGRPRSGARLIVASDEGMNKVVATRLVPTGSAINGTLKTRVGRLKPYTEYFYLWESGTGVSPVGRARTLPHPSSTQPLTLGFSSCQEFRQGYFTPHLDAAAANLDLYAFLGDYIYAEGRTPNADQVRPDGTNANDLRSYRRKYARYRTDEALRELHRVQSCVHIWDDHEVENNYTDNHPAPSPLQRTAGYRASFEWLPRTVDKADRFRIYKRISLGQTADLFLLDERQYRTVDDAGRPVRLLGEQQANWLLAGLRASRATWKIIGNQVLIAPIDYGRGQPQDSWGGYDAVRTALLGAIEREGITNVVFMTGDSHVFMVNALASDPDTFRTDPGHRPAAIEYVAGSITSAGANRAEAEVQANNPWNLQYNGAVHGYAHMRLDQAGMTIEYRASDITRPDGGTVAFERFTQPAGTNGVSRGRLT
jgi:alkaline phosphatase D